MFAETCRGSGWCPPGRMCHEGICVCGDQAFCAKHRKPVCGHDNVLYPSHCELHRTACVTKKHIRIDFEAKCRTNQQTTSSVAVSMTTTVEPSTILGSLCEFIVRHATAGILWGQKVMTAKVNSLDECRDVCETADKGCMGFEYSESEKYCGLYDNMDDVIFWPNTKMTFYEKKRCKEPEPEESTCGYEMVKLTSDPVYGMCHITVHLLPDFEKCVAECQGCKAFTYKTYGGVCEIFYNQLCVDMLNKQGTVHYVRHCNSEGMGCRILEMIPGRSPFMCSKATSSVANLIECHDTCVRGHCQAFRFKNDGSEFCEIFFDKSCIPMLEKGKDNYYVRRCANPEDCKYEEVESKGGAPCEIVSSNTDTFEKCRESCSSCVAFKYLYDSGECSLFQQTSCITKKNINYIKRDCHRPEIEAGTTTDVNHVIAMAPTPDHLSVKKELKDNVENQDDTISKGDQNKQTTVIIPTAEPKSDQQVQRNSGLDHLEVVEGGAKTMQDPDAKEVKKDGRTGVSDVKVDQDPDTLYGESGEKDDDSMYEKICTLQEYNRMKGDILRYHCVKLGEAHCGDTQIPKKSYIATLMFSFYDRNMDESIQKDELWEIWLMENFDKMFSSCTLLDLFKFENIKDDAIYKDDFLDIFDIPEAAMQEEIQVITTLATVGNGLEIRCGLQPSSDVSQIVWRRHGMDLMEVTFPGLAVFSDGTLYLESVDIHHIGNWTCHDRDKPGVKQVHVLDVHLPPIVSVAPSTQLFPEDNTDIYIHCHADGIPKPTLEWEVNGHKLPDKQDHFIRTHDNGSLIIYQSNYQTDTGTYKCIGKNAAGKAEDVATVYIQKPNQTDIANYHMSRHESFFVFHKNGFTVYDPTGCYFKRHVKETFGNLLHMPEELDSAPSLCPGVGECRWGQSVNVMGKFVYVSQPYQSRVVVIDAEKTLNPVEFIQTDHYPSKIYYIEHLDEVWVLCWNSDQSTGSKTIIVIREASKDIRHHIVHTQPIGYRFDLVQDLFLPPPNSLNYNYHYGYVLHTGQKGLFKLELDSMRYTKAVDLTAFDCVPQSVAFVPIGGSIIVNCIQHPSQSEQVTIQILLDYITDTPLGNLTLYGTPYITPDSRNVVTVDKIRGDVRVAEVLKNGNIKKAFDVTVGSSVSDVTFLPSELGSGYDAFLTSAESPEVFSINLSNGKITTIKDVDDPRQTRVTPFSAATRSITSGDVFSEFVASPGRSSLFIFNGKHNKVHCQFYNLLDPDSVVYSVSRSR
ncbi:hypothetical protein FSP39_021930 [Pinctada imbricata]|uniref:Follistatin-related protein 5 n=1 Tax=Pinctada imbricata TaxID=66713 RepID=A0AA88Y917_PINIB|nr:hypothetical protein FSP39_021930 [Pinctada imbricata]